MKECYRTWEDRVPDEKSSVVSGKSECAGSAETFFERQTRYDLLHHKMRIRDLEAMEQLSSINNALIKQSYGIVESPVNGYRSVNLDDCRYLAELDKFEKQNEKSERR